MVNLQPPPKSFVSPFYLLRCGSRNKIFRFSQRQSSTYNRMGLHREFLLLHFATFLFVLLYACLPQITKKNVDGYCGQGMMPCCRLKVKWKGGDNTELKQLVTLEGAKESSNVFELMCSYEGSAHQ